MVVPSKWFSGGKGLDEFRATMLNDRRLRRLVDFPDSREAFDGVDIAGGVNYFLWDRDHEGKCRVDTVSNGVSISVERELNEYEIFVRDNRTLDIIKRIEASEDKSFAEMVSARRPFNLDSNNRSKEGDLYLYASGEDGRIGRDQVSKGADLIDRWKVLVSKTSSEHAGQTDKSGKKRVLSRIEVMPPQSVATESYLVVGPFATKTEADNASEYMRTRFFRFLVSSVLLTQNITRRSFMFVPEQDFTRQWTDNDLYEKYGIPEDEIAFIESTIRPMEKLA